MPPEKNRITEQFQPDRCRIDENTDERKYNKPASSFLAKIEKNDENSHENEDCAHSENMNVGEFQSKDKFFGLVKGGNLCYLPGSRKINLPANQYGFPMYHDSSMGVYRYLGT